MKKFILVFAVGVACGYLYGFRDAKTHHGNIVERVIARVGGSNRDNYKNDIDKKFERLER
jgi:hypothetical protein